MIIVKESYFPAIIDILFIQLETSIRAVFDEQSGNGPRRRPLKVQDRGEAVLRKHLRRKLRTFE